MKKFEELKNNSVFNVGVWELKPTFKSEEFINKYVFNSYVQGLTFSFIKTGENTCKELLSGTEFNLEELLMTNEEIGLCFFGGYVNDIAAKNTADKEYTTTYFKAAKEANKNNKKLIRK